ncbi:MAG: DUF1329 domain-containing protein [Gammaproteobacteria bacterium]|nr:MAG: DUF1329 domain-containing protein [Gammaproteobacteria bacterium]
MKITKTVPLLTALALSLLSFTATQAAVSETEAARLGKDLTPMGAIKAGNADGSIPAWDGGITTPPAGYKPGDHHQDPYASDKILYTITAQNKDQYKDILTAGHLAMLEAYPDSFKLNVYPSRRSAAYPQRIYDETVKNATRAKLVADGNGVEDAIIGVPFPIPANGHEVIWNHLLRYRGDIVGRWIAQAVPTRSGKYTLVKFEDEFDMLYSQPGAKFADLNNVILYFKQKVIAPARLAGFILLAHETLNQIKQPRMAWTYNTGQRRVRRAPNVAYDNPGTASDGIRTSDQFDMFNGAPDRYDWKLVGRKEMIVPYNDYKLHSSDVKYKDILTPKHINPDLTRYEKHRVWVVEATLKEGTSHIYSRRTFYIDEDSWQILVVDQYDRRGNLWRVSEGFVINYYDVPTLWTTLEVHTDLQAGRYLAIGLDNESRMYDFNLKRTAKNYTPAALRREGLR